ncbi:MAG TPA: urate hydroxylase PuuD [Acetobacteraceae bacterium]|nr:urate hydroxylase PuuD [Acetobacteraceae bacterium]
MTGYISQWAMALLVWLHVVAAIAWIGESFYFVMLDNSLHPPDDELSRQRKVYGELWSVHGGGFYHAQKYLVSPPQMPADLHWSKWKSYMTWISGFTLLTVMYLLQPGTYLLDPSVARITPGAGIGAVLGFLIVGWLVYDTLCRLLGDRDLLLGIVIAIFVALAAFVSTHLFAPQAAFLIVGAMLGTIMSANVFFWIIPGQKKMVATLARGEIPDPTPGRRGKQRSVHNTYFTLPVVFAMLSSHFGMLFSHPASWVYLWLVMVAGALIRQFFVLWHAGRRNFALPVAGAVLIALVIIAVAPGLFSSPGAQTASAAPRVSTIQVMAVIHSRCAACHSAHPTLMPSAPNGIMFDTPDEVKRQAALILQQAVQAKAMPPGNITHITSAERQEIAAWVGEQGK